MGKKFNEEKYIGQKFNRLTFLCDTGERKHKQIVAKFKCDCGKIHKTVFSPVKTGKVVSCGCKRKEDFLSMTKKGIHNLTHTRIYNIWCSMRARCNNPKAINYHNYGGRGIKVCHRWNNSFLNFLKDMGIPAKGLQIDRINNDDNYYKENCQWATPTKNSRNKRTNRKVLFDNKIEFLSIVCKKLKIDYGTALKYLKKGMSYKGMNLITETTTEIRSEQGISC